MQREESLWARWLNTQRAHIPAALVYGKHDWSRQIAQAMGLIVPEPHHILARDRSDHGDHHFDDLTAEAGENLLRKP